MMQARADIILEVGTVLISLKTGDHVTIIKVIKNVKTRNTSGVTNKTHCRYVLDDGRGQLSGYYSGRALNRGDLLNQYRPLESKTEKLLYER